MTRLHPRVLGQLLLATGEIDRETLEAALAEQRSTGERIGEVLVRRGLDPEALARSLALQLRLPYAGPPVRADRAALRTVDARLAARLRVVPMTCDERVIRIAMADPLDADAIADLQFQTGRRVEPHVASPAAIAAALAAYDQGEVEALVTRMPSPGRRPPDAERPEVAALRRAAEAAPIISLVDLILARAIRSGASDVHIEPAGPSVRVRSRIDGVLRETATLPAQAAGPFGSRVKVMADMDIAVKRRPQDGRAKVMVDGRELGLRVSTLPAQDGEKIVIRILDPHNAGLGLDELGFEPGVLEAFGRLLGRSHGVILVTGPTGSGKTTTLYAGLGRLDREKRNIVTLEDPIEYRLAGLTQVQVHRKAGLGFPVALRAVLRQDPDVLMVGELRDRETVETAMAAAMTGHLVLSTVHTNDAPSAATRLVDMGAPPWLIAAGLIGVLAQRLARKLCRHCAVERIAPAAELAALGLPDRATTLFEPRGCHRCDNLGFRGRVGVFELLPITARVRELIAKGARVDALRAAGRAAGMVPLAQDAWRKVGQGRTSLSEVAPLLGMLAAESPACARCGSSIRPGFLACPACGSRLLERCPCGAKLAAGWRYCARCARAVNGRTETEMGGRASPDRKA